MLSELSKAEAVNKATRFGHRVALERERQVDKWGNQRVADIAPLTTSDYRYLAQAAKVDCQTAHERGQDGEDLILLEEVYEALEQLQAGNLKEARDELVQVAAVCAWIDECLAEQLEAEGVPTLVEEFAPCNERYSKFEEFRGVKINLGIGRCAKRKGHPAEIEHGDA